MTIPTSQHPALQPGQVAVITGGASGIGLATAKAMLALGLKVCIGDCHEQNLQLALAELTAQARAAGQGPEQIMGQQLDTADFAQMTVFRDRVMETFGQVNLLMNNAGIGRPSSSWTALPAWQEVLGVNLMGVVHGVQAFTQVMLDQGQPGLIINTGSKQGITCPPGSPAYNVSKAGVKALTESLAHELRNQPHSQVSAHLLVPGFVYTGMMKARLPEKPAAAWTPEQTVAFMLESLDNGDFYILCPDGEVTRAMDEKRIAWAAADLIENRPALSRWHPDFAKAFAEYMQS